MSEPVTKDGAFRRSEKALLVMMACSLVCVVLSLLFGALGALYYIPRVSARLVGVGVSLVQLRPLHTTFASAWIFLGAATCAYKYLFDTFGEPGPGDWRRFRLHMVLWGLAGLGVLVTLPFGLTSGREYLGFHPALSLLVWVGWALFAWSFVSKVWRGFAGRPVYVHMWTVGILFFLWTFAEGHAYLLPAVRGRPVVDLQIQWKSCGTLVASFNQMVYGSLIFVAARMAGDERIAHSRTAFALFGIGLLNSFTNFAHHTYHLPQSHVVKWIAFGVSMLEVIILVQLFREVLATMNGRRPPLRETRRSTVCLFSLSKRWNLVLLPLAIVISVPHWNALVHGTHVVMAHAMGSELAIDSYILLGAFAFLLASIFPKREVHEEIIDGPLARSAILTMNGFLVGLFALLVAGGATTGVQRYLGRPMPEWMDVFPPALVFLGGGLAVGILRLLTAWAPLFLAPVPHRRWGTGVPGPARPAAQPAPTRADPRRWIP